MARIEYTDWTVPVAQVGSRAGQTMQVDRDFPAPGGIGDSIVGVKEGEPIHVNGQFRLDYRWSHFHRHVHGAGHCGVRALRQGS